MRIIYVIIPWTMVNCSAARFEMENPKRWRKLAWDESRRGWPRTGRDRARTWRGRARIGRGRASAQRGQASARLWQGVGGEKRPPRGPKVQKKIEISIEIENFDREWNFRASHPPRPYFCGEMETSRLKISSEIKNFDRDLKFRSRWNFFDRWALWAININNFAGLSRKWVGVKLFMCFPFSWGKRETHKQNSQEISGKGRESPGTVPG